jgi:hypothetical protein
VLCQEETKAEAQGHKIGSYDAGSYKTLILSANQNKPVTCASVKKNFFARFFFLFRQRNQQKIKTLPLFFGPYIAIMRWVLCLCCFVGNTL